MSNNKRSRAAWEAALGPSGGGRRAAAGVAAPAPPSSAAAAEAVAPVPPPLPAAAAAAAAGGGGAATTLPAGTATTMATLQRLRAEFSTVATMKRRDAVARLLQAPAPSAFVTVAGVPALLVSVVRAACRDRREAAEDDLRALRAAGVIRLCYRPSGGGSDVEGDAAYALTSDLRDYIQRWRAGPGAAALGARGAAVIAAAYDALLDDTAAPYVLASEWETVFGRAGASRPSSTAAAAAAAAAAAPPSVALAPDTALGALVKLGLLHERVDGGAAVTGRRAPAYWFGIPESGRLWQWVDAGRSELRTRLRALRYHEAPVDEAVAMRFARSSLPTALHVADAIGIGTVAALSIGGREYIRLVAPGDDAH